MTLHLPYTDPIDWDRFQEKVRAALADCRLASTDLSRRPRFEIVLQPAGVPTPTAVQPGFRPDRDPIQLIKKLLYFCFRFQNDFLTWVS